MLHPVIDRDDMKPRRFLRAVAGAAPPCRLPPLVALPAGHVARQIHAVETGPGLRLVAHRGEIEPAVRLVGNDPVRRSLVANEAGQAPCIDPVQPDDAVRFEPRIERLLGAVIGRFGRQVADHETARRRGGRFEILVIGADIADMGKGERDDLRRVGRIGQDFLIAGNRRIETDLADCLAGRADPAAPKHRAVGEHQRRVAVGRSRRRPSRGRIGHCGMSSRHRRAPSARGRAGRAGRAAGKRPEHKTRRRVVNRPEWN